MSEPEENTEGNEMKFIGLLTVTTFCMFLSSIYSGYVLTILWAWFVVTTFEAPALSLPAAIGLSLTVGYLTNHLRATKEDQEKTWADWLSEGIAMAITRPTIALVMGAIVSAWM